MHPIKPIQTAKIGYIAISLMLCALGVVLMIYPELSANVLCYLIGALLICYGVFKVIGYLSRDLFRLAFQFDLAFGLLTAAVGLLVILSPARMRTLLNVLLGIFVFADGLFKIQISLDSKRFGIRQWWVILTLAVLTVVFGALLMADPFHAASLLMVWLGVSLLAEGILNFCVMLCTVKIIRNQRPDVIEVEFEPKEEFKS